MRLCSEAGCSRSIPEDRRYCDKCKPQHGKAAEASGDGLLIRKHTYADREQHGHLYGTRRWKKVQPLVLARDPLCKRCTVALAEIADHVVPSGVAIEQARASGRWPLDPYAGFFLMSNLTGVCRSCHKTKTDEDKAHTGEWPDVVAAYDAAPKRKWTF